MQRNEPEKQPLSLDEMSEVALLRARNSTFELAKSIVWAIGSGSAALAIHRWGIAPELDGKITL